MRAFSHHDNDISNKIFILQSLIEELEHVLKRGAKTYCERTGYSAVESIACIKAIKHGIIPPTINLK